MQNSSALKSAHCTHCVYCTHMCIMVSAPSNSSSFAHACADTWPQLFIEDLNRALPCSGGQHTMQNLAESGASSAWWVDTILGSRAAYYDYDAVLVETALNDVEELAREGRNTKAKDAYLKSERVVGKYTEILINMLLNLPKRPAVFYFGASTRLRYNFTVEFGRTADSVHVHVPVTRRYGVPHVSVIDGIGPFLNSVPDKIQWLKGQLDWCCHGTILMHKIGARMLMDLLMSQYWSWQVAPGVMPAYTPRSPLFSTQSELQMYCNATPFPLATIREADVPFRLVNLSHGFVSMEDVPNKPGLISNVTGSTVVYQLKPQQISNNLKMGVLHVEHLRSYKHMGSFVMEVRSVNSTNGECGDVLTSTLLATKTIDSAWKELVSEVQVDEVRFDVGGMTDRCLILNVTIVPSSPPREENKVKLVGVVLF